MADKEEKKKTAKPKEVQKSSIVERIKELEEELKKTPYNKRTQHSIGLTKAKLARLREKQEARISKKGSKEGFSIRKSGDATAILVGFPSVGKSTMLNGLTNAKSPVGYYAFTTLTAIPGQLKYNNATIQVIDCPGVIKGAALGIGRGKEVLALLRNADLILIIFDVNATSQCKTLTDEIFNTGIRLNQRIPDITIKKTSKNGIDLGTTCRLTKIDKKTIISILKEFKIINAQVVIRENITADQLIDSIERNKYYTPGLIVANKIDTVSSKKLEMINEKMRPDCMISADKNINLDVLKEQIYEKLSLMSVFCKERGKKADLGVPLILKRDSTIKDMCFKLHKDFVIKFKFARVWGKSAKFPGQKFSLNHKLQDEDIVELHVI